MVVNNLHFIVHHVASYGTMSAAVDVGCMCFPALPGLHTLILGCMLILVACPLAAWMHCQPPHKLAKIAYIVVIL